MGLKPIFTAKQISKTYKGYSALNNVTFSIEKGDIFGLIGANGAGKTTLMKIIAGSIKPTYGEICLMGYSGQQTFLGRKDMGILIENPAYYGEMNAFENLQLICLAKKIKDPAIIHSTLDIVGLNEVKNRKISKYSLGMKQRLGLAIALIGSPQFLILDEPTNGLDPNGIIDMRDLIIRLNKDHGITILISNHILTELDQVANRYAILNKGNLVALHTEKELKNQCKKQTIIVHDDNPNNISNYLSQYNITDILIESNTITFFDNGCIPQDLLSRLIHEKFNILEYYNQQESLEEFFIRTTTRKDVIEDA